MVSPIFNMLKIGETIFDLQRADLPGSVIVGIRPEHFEPATGPEATAFKPTLIEDTGAESFFNFAWNDTAVVARLPAKLAKSQRDNLTLGIDKSSLCFFDPETETLI